MTIQINCFDAMFLCEQSKNSIWLGCCGDNQRDAIHFLGLFENLIDFPSVFIIVNAAEIKTLYGGWSLYEVESERPFESKVTV